jgi:hypothetical protein
MGLLFVQRRDYGLRIAIDVSSSAASKRPHAELSNAVKASRASKYSGAAAASWSAEPPMPSSSQVPIPGVLSAFVDPHSIKRSNKRKAGVVQRFIDAMEEVEIARSNEPKPAKIAKKAAAVVAAAPRVRPPVILPTSTSRSDLLRNELQIRPADAHMILSMTLCSCGQKDPPTRAHRGGLAAAPVFILTCANARVDCYPTHSYCWFKSSTLLLRSSDAMKRIATGIADGSMLFVCKRCRSGDNQYRDVNEVVRDGSLGIVYKRQSAHTSRVALYIHERHGSSEAVIKTAACAVSSTSNSLLPLKSQPSRGASQQSCSASFMQLHAALIAPIHSAPTMQIRSAAAFVAATSTSENALAAASASPSGPEATDSTPMGL